MNQNKVPDYPKVISMGEYLDKRKEQKKNAPETKSRQEESIPASVAWAFTEMYI